MPIAIPLIVGSFVTGTALNAYGQVRAGAAAKAAGEAQQRAANSEADILDYNASVSDLQSQDAIERGAIDESRFRAQVRQVIGSTRASYAAQGVDVASGSPLDVATDQAYIGELDAIQIRQNAKREAWGYNVTAYDTRARADIARKEGVVYAAAGREAQTEARIGAAASVLGATGSLLMMRYGFPQARVPAQPGDLSHGDLFAYGGLG